MLGRLRKQQEPALGSPMKGSAMNASTQSKPFPSFEELSGPSFLEAVTHAGNSVLQSIADSQQQILATLKTVAEHMPKAPENVAPAVPFAYPTARELVEANFDFADRFLAGQKAFAQKYL